MQNKITFKISVSHTGEHHLLGISFSGAKNGRIKSLRKCGERTINQISKIDILPRLKSGRFYDANVCG